MADGGLPHVLFQRRDDGISCAAALGLVCVMTGLKLQPNSIIIHGSLLMTGTLEFVEDITLDYLERVHAQGFKVLAVEEEAYDRAKEEDGDLLDANKWKGMRIEKVLDFSDVLILAFGTMYHSWLSWSTFGDLGLKGLRFDSGIDTQMDT